MATRQVDAQVPEGQLWLDEVQCHNLRVLDGCQHSFSVFQPPPEDSPLDLVEVEGDVRLMHQDVRTPGLVLDAEVLTAIFLKAYFGRVVAANELCVVVVKGVSLIIRITCTHVLDAAEREEAIAYHCFRGRLAATTTVYLGQQQSTDDGPATKKVLSVRKEEGQEVEQHIDSSSVGLTLTNVRSRAFRPVPRDVVNVVTSDGECFPVKKALLRPCIALTKAVRSWDVEALDVNVEVDTLTFDRVLLFLEAQALGRPAPHWSLHLVELLAQTTKSHGPDSTGALRLFTYEQVVAANAAGSLWLILDGMVLDVTDWLSEHPGGKSIIPRQALNLDCARFFEIYHASRESFLYLKDFYIGELLPEERSKVTQGAVSSSPEEAPPSADFLQQLQEYTSGFRLQGLEGARQPVRNL
ncbi:MAG: hypothetical protein WDW38_009344 [Sanguina aurantia]